MIGDNIRKLSGLWEKKGVRLHLLVWEDYKAEYKGQSKQTDYDLDLVGKADLHPENDQHGRIMSINKILKILPLLNYMKNKFQYLWYWA